MIDGGYYLFPELKFQCEADITRLRGYFSVDPSEDTPFYLQIWRKQNNSDSYIREEQVNLNLSAHCQNDGDIEQCYVDYLMPRELEVESDDFIGFYTGNNTLARPLFSSSMSNTQLYLVQARFSRRQFIDGNEINNMTVSYRPQVFGKSIVQFLV